MTHATTRAGASLVSAPLPAPAEPGAITLAGEGTAPPMAPESWFALAGQATVRNVSVATLTPVLPDPDRATGAAMVVAPGGGFLVEAMENEGWPPARWLADRGIAAFVLKYRTQPTPPDLDAFRAAVQARFAAAAAAAAGDPRRIEAPGYAIADAQAAIRLVRQRAAAWRVDPARVGYLGFSAGAMLGLGAVAAGAADAMPAFLATIYPSMSAVEVAPDAPPLFVAMAADDPLYGRQGYGLAESWRRAERPVELHVYAGGGHGYGMGRAGTTSTGTMAALGAWLRCGGWLGGGAGPEEV